MDDDLETVLQDWELYLDCDLNFPYAENIQMILDKHKRGQCLSERQVKYITGLYSIWEVYDYCQRLRGNAS